MNDLGVNVLITIEVDNVLEEIDLVTGWRIKVCHLYLDMPAFSFFFLLSGKQFDSFLREVFCDAQELSLYFQNWPLLFESIFPEVLDEEEGEDMEIVFLDKEEIDDALVHLVDQLELKLVCLNQLNDVKDLSS